MFDAEVIGGGLAGSEAAWQLAQRGFRVRLAEMRPERRTPAHKTDRLAELVCSNSFRGASLENAVGLLKEEMRRLGSLIMEAADATSVPAGGALAVDRDRFAAAVTEAIAGHPPIELCRAEREGLPEGPAVIATGPLTSDALARAIAAFTGEGTLAFYDAAAPIVTAESLDLSKLFRASRYGKGEEAYLNAPMTEAEYDRFWNELVRAETAPREEFDRIPYFEGCLPIEVMAKRGRKTLLYGPLKPVGLIDPATGRRPFAVVQLRPENREETLYNLVGFQTSLRWGEQVRVFRLIPGLEKAEFERLGVMHRNTFLKSPRILHPTLETRRRPGLFFAGQMTGVEGYVESAAGGLVAGINLARRLAGMDPLPFPRETAIGSLCAYITEADADHFQPMNAAFGLMPPLPERIRDRRERHRRLAERALERLDRFIVEHRLVAARVASG